MFSKEKILLILKNNKKSFKYLARSLNIPINQNKKFSNFLFKMIQNCELMQTKEKEYFVPIFLGKFEGIIRINIKGFGFVDNQKESYFIPVYGVNSALDGDLVEIKYFKEEKSSFIGIVSKIIKRNITSFVGKVIKNKYGINIKPFNEKIKGNFIFKDNSKVKINQEIKVKIIEVKNQKIIIDIEKFIFNNNSISKDILIEIEDSNLPFSFPKNILEKAKKIPQTINKEEVKNRQDFRENLIITIDGSDTKDYDDAIEVKKLSNGNFKLGVHIADVTHYIEEGDNLDEEAKKRGTSIYLVDEVIPMLPKELSNGICSLNPNVDRFTISINMEINKKGEIINYELCPSIIKSKYRLTYKEVNEYYKGNKIFEDKKLNKMLNDSLELSYLIREFKKNKGYIDFEIEESKIITDKKGKTIDIIVKERGESEMMIEDFMVLSNETVAKHMFKNKKPSIYRVHDKPEIEKVVSLTNVLKILGLNIQISNPGNAKEFSKEINKLKTLHFDNFIKIMLLRTMSKAIYSTNNIGHFGLASKEYTHFTSPIRRYPDLMVHRMIREYFFKKEKKEKHFELILPKIAELSSIAEQKAADLERKILDIKKSEYYEQFINKDLIKAKIVSIMKFGMFVEFDNKVSALLHVSNLLDGKYELDKTGYKLTNGINEFTLGDTIEVVVIGVIKQQGKIDVILSKHFNEWKLKNK